MQPSGLLFGLSDGLRSCDLGLKVGHLPFDVALECLLLRLELEAMKKGEMDARKKYRVSE